MSKQSTPVHRPAPCWFFRDRAGRRFGPYTDAKAIRDILKNHRVGRIFEPAVECGCRAMRPATEFVMEDAEYHCGPHRPPLRSKHKLLPCARPVRNRLWRCWT